MRRSVRAADGAGLENQWAEMSRGFESHGLRQKVGASLALEVKERFRPTVLKIKSLKLLRITPP